MDNFIEIIMSDTPSIQIKENEEFMFSMIPFFRRCKGFDQKNKWHPYDVYEHTLKVIDNVDKDLVLRLAALFHDIGKPSSYKEESGQGRFPGHWLTSTMIFGGFAKQNGIDEDIQRRVSDLIYYHDYDFSSLTDEDIDTIKERLSKDEVDDLFKLKRADLTAQNLDFSKRIIDDLDRQEEALLSYYDVNIK